MRPILGFRLSYLPLIMVYFAYGALGLIDVTRDMWIKEQLKLDPSELASIGVWLSLPWTVKMVFGELVDSVPIFGSQRRSYIVIGAALTAAGMLTLAGAAGGHPVLARAEYAYLVGALLIVIGTLIQDVVADAMSTEVIARVDEAGNARPEQDIRAELGMVQVLGRLALSFGILAVAGLSGWLASILDRQTVFMLGLIVPAVSVTGVLLIRSEKAERRPLDLRILGGGIGFGAIVIALAIGGLPLAQEMIFILSMAVICTMLVLVTRAHPASRRAILFTSIIIFAFRATPSVGDRYFCGPGCAQVRRGVLRHIASDRRPPAPLSRCGSSASSLPNIPWRRFCSGSSLRAASCSCRTSGCSRLHNWTESLFGFGAHDRSDRRGDRITISSSA